MYRALSRNGALSTYYIDMAYEHRKAYYDFCKQLFTKGQAGLFGAAFQQGLAAPLAVPTFR